MKKFFVDAAKFAGIVGLLSVLSIFPLLPFSCKLTDEGLELVAASEDTSPPTLVSFNVVGANVVRLEFSEFVSLSDVKLTDSIGVVSEINASKISFDSGHVVAEIEFPDSTCVGKDYIFEAVVSDKKGNSLDFKQKFLGYNDNPARLVLNEIRGKSSSNSKNPLNTKVEYLEFYALKGGNLAGIEIQFGYHSKSYKFPPITVRADEFIVLHLKSFGNESDGFVDELGDDLNISSAIDSSSSRDLWIAGTDSILSQSDVIAVRNSYTGIPFDGVEMSTVGKNSWFRSNQKELASSLFKYGIWNGESPETAALIDNSTPSRTLSRMNLQKIKEDFSSNPNMMIKSTSDDWRVVTKATPGENNSIDVYVKK